MTTTNHRELRSFGRVLGFAFQRFVGNALAMFVVISLLLLLLIWGTQGILENLVSPIHEPGDPPVIVN